MESQAPLPIISAPSGDNTGGYLGEMCLSKIFDDTISNGQGLVHVHHVLEVYLVVWQEGKNGLFEFLLGILNNAWYSIYYFRLYVTYIFSYFTGIVSSDSFVVLGYSIGMEK